MKNSIKFMNIIWLPAFLSVVFALLASFTSWISETIPMFSFFNIFETSQVIYVRFVPIFISGLIAYKMSKKRDGAATLSGIISYLIFTNLASAATLNEAFYYFGYKVPAALTYLDNPLIGICCGLIAAYTYDHFNHIKLPDYLAFFSGKRFVPILTSFITILLSLPIALCFVFLFHTCKEIMAFLYCSGNVGVSFGACFDSLLLPLGLKGLFSSFYILPGMFEGIELLYHFVIPVLLVMLMHQLKIQKKYLGVLMVLLLASLFTRNTIAFELFLFLCSPCIWLFHCLMIFLVTFLVLTIPSYKIVIVLCSLALYYAVFVYVHPSEKNFEFLDFTSLSSTVIEEIIHHLGGADNIIQITLEEEDVAILLLGAEFVDDQKLEQMDEVRCRIENDYIYLYANENNDYIYNEISKIVHEDCLELEDI